MVHLVFEVRAEGKRTEAEDENNKTTRCNLRGHNITIFFKKSFVLKIPDFAVSMAYPVFMVCGFPVVLNVVMRM